MLIAPFPPPERGRARRPSIDDRRVFEGILRVARTGSPWRDLLELLGKSNAVWRRFARRRDAGVFEDLLDALAAGGAGDAAEAEKGEPRERPGPIARRVLDQDPRAVGGPRTVARGPFHAWLFEQNDEWQTQHRTMQVEAFSRIDAAADPVLSITTEAA